MMTPLDVADRDTRSSRRMADRPIYAAQFYIEMGTPNK
jgi:hypothetical protein